MLIKESHVDVQTSANGKESSMSMPDSNSEDVTKTDGNSTRHRLTNNNWQESSCSTLLSLDIPKRENFSRLSYGSSAYTSCSRFPGVLVFSEIYQGENSNPLLTQDIN